MHTLQCLGLFNFLYFVHFLWSEPSVGSCGPGLPTSLLPAWLALSPSPPLDLPPETRGKAGPQSSWQCWWGRGGLVSGGALGRTFWFFFVFPTPHPPKHLDHWLTFSSAPKVLRRDWVCVWVWLSSLVFPEDGEGTLAEWERSGDPHRGMRGARGERV